MNRKEMYQYIIRYDLNNVIVSLYGRNYTNVCNDCLQAVIAKHAKSLHKPAATPTPVVRIELDNKFKQAIVLQLAYLKQLGMLDEILNEVK